MKKMNNIVLSKNFAYVNESDKRIPKNEIVALFDNAFNEGCMNFRKEEGEFHTNYIYEHENGITKVAINNMLLKENDKLVNDLDDVLSRVEQLKNVEIEKQERQEKNKIINNLKKFISITVFATVVGYALSKAAPAIVKWDNKKFETELEESGAKEMQQNLEMQQNHEEAMEHYYQDQKIEQQKQEQQTREFEEQLEQINQEYTQKMIDDMELYRDFDTMPGVTKIEESNVKVH